MKSHVFWAWPVPPTAIGRVATCNTHRLVLHTIDTYRTIVLPTDTPSRLSPCRSLMAIQWSQRRSPRFEKLLLDGLPVRNPCAKKFALTCSAQRWSVCGGPNINKVSLLFI